MARRPKARAGEGRADEPHFNPPVRQRRLADQIYEQILEQISTGKLAEDQRLPSEKAFCELFGVSRGIVREALVRLAADELVISRQGLGTFVARRPAPGFLAEASGGVPALFRAWELRAPIECEAAYLAALRRSGADLAAMRRAVAGFAERALRPEGALPADLRFHRAVASATGNELFVAALESLRASIEKGMRLANRLAWTDQETRHRCILGEHRRILAQIEAADARGARLAMRRHLNNSRRRIFGARAGHAVADPDEEPREDA